MKLNLYFKGLKWCYLFYMLNLKRMVEELQLNLNNLQLELNNVTEQKSNIDNNFNELTKSSQAKQSDLESKLQTIVRFILHLVFKFYL